MLEIRLAAVDALLLVLGDRACAQTADRVATATAILRTALADCLTDLVPSYASVLLTFDLRRTRAAVLSDRVTALLQDLDQRVEASDAGTLVTLPVWYDPSVGADLQAVAQRHQLEIAELIEIHAAPEYRVYAIGFSPGFGYLGDVDQRIATPRLARPRVRVPAGSVALAERQTAVYPQSTPGGWNLLGRCPLRLFDAQKPPYLRFQVGDRVRFEPIDRAEYQRLQALTE
jgi:KipI family sensor histidine kinase inhibitor